MTGLLVGVLIILLASLVIVPLLIGLPLLREQRQLRLDERHRLHAEVRAAEWRLHRLASRQFQAVLDAARSEDDQR